MDFVSPVEHFKTQPRKRIGAVVLIFKEKSLLIVKPSYNPRWLLPGGGVGDNESPRTGVTREIKEELNVTLVHLEFIGVDYMPAQGEKNESLQFIFYGGELDESETPIQVDGKEITEYKWVDIETAMELLGVGRSLAKRLPACIAAVKSGRPLYLENGEWWEKPHLQWNG